MKKLVISVKSPGEALNDFSQALKRAKKTKGKVSPYYEIAFDNKKDFNKFLKNISILMLIQSLKPKSIYELAKMAGIDQSNLNKIILFFEEIGALKIKVRKVNGRTVKTPIVEYDKIEFNLAA